MYIGVIFWILVILWAIFGAMAAYPAPAGQAGDRRFVWGGVILELVLFALLGWKVFGPAVHS